MIEYEGPPERWIARGGLPASCLGDSKRACGGMPSYMHEDNGLVVFDLLVAQDSPSLDPMMLFSRWYGTACLLAPQDTVPLHHGVEAWWAWRPVIYRRSIYGVWQGLGSQRELAWRFGLYEMTHSLHMGTALSMANADVRADTLLMENLSPFQAAEMALTGKFRVRGAATENVYEIDVGDGFAIVDKVTGERVVNYCLHPEYWIPDADIALATKLALEDPDLEPDVLENARGTLRKVSEPRTPALRAACAIERDLIA